MKKKLGIVIAILGTVMSLVGCGKKEVKKVDIVAGASQIPLANTKYMEDSKSVGRYFLRIGEEDKFIGYNAEYKIDENTVYQMRVTGAGPDGKWFNSDDEINKYYKITRDEHGNEISNFSYSDNAKQGIAYFGENDKVSKGSKVIEFNKNNQPTKTELYKGADKVTGYIISTYDADNKLVKTEEYDAKDVLKENSDFTYKTEGNTTVRRETRYKKGKLKDFREAFFVDGKMEKFVKHDSQGRIYATETEDTIKQVF